MAGSDFEKDMQEQLQGLRFTPDDFVWEQVEASLPPVRRRRRLLFWWLLPALLVPAALFIFTNNPKETSVKQTAPASAQLPAEKTAESAAGVYENKGPNKEEAVAGTQKAAPEKDAGKAPGSLAENSCNATSPAGKKIEPAGNENLPKELNSLLEASGKKTVAQDVALNGGLVKVQGDNNAVSGNGKTVAKEAVALQKQPSSGAYEVVNNYKVNHPMPGSGDSNHAREEKAGDSKNAIAGKAVAVGPDISQDKKTETRENSVELLNAQNAPAPEKSQESGASAAGDPLKNTSLKQGQYLNASPDSAKAIAVKPLQKTAGKNWRAGLVLLAGRSNVKEGAFLSFNNANKSMASAPNTGGTNSGSISYTAATPRAAFAWAAGVFAEKPIAKSWQLQLGLHYGYYASQTPVGQLVDSSFSQYNGGLNLSSDNFYRNGRIGQVNNHISLLELPVDIRFRPKKLPLFVQGGITLSYLTGTNMLQYNSNRNLYFYDRTVYNNWMLQVQAGAGLDFSAWRVLPFAIGYQWNAGASSLIKKSQGQQSLVSSRVFLRFYLKK